MRHIVRDLPFYTVFVRKKIAYSLDLRSIQNQEG